MKTTNFNDKDRNPLISIIMPTFNRVNFLKKAIKSIQKQTYDNFELIVVDDASTDNTENLISSLRDNRLIYVKNPKNMGGAASRNVGIHLAKGEYIGFLDDDDEWLPSKLEKQVSFFNEHPEVDIVYTGFLVRDINVWNIIGQIVPKMRGMIREELLMDNCIGTTSTLLVKRGALLRTNLFDETLPSCQDWDLWISLSKFCYFDYLAEPLVIYSVHGDRISNNIEAVLEGRKKIFAKYKEEIEKNKNILARHYLKIGSAYCQLGNMNKGRKYMKDGLKLDYDNIEIWAALLATYLGVRNYNHFINIRRIFIYKYYRLKPFMVQNNDKHRNPSI